MRGRAALGSVGVEVSVLALSTGPRSHVGLQIMHYLLLDAHETIVEALQLLVLSEVHHQPLRGKHLRGAVSQWQPLFRWQHLRLRWVWQFHFSERLYRD